MKTSAVHPRDIRPVGGNEILITWQDNHRSLYGQRYLRLSCACAQCLDEMTGKRLLQPKNIANDIHMDEMTPVGNYGIRFRWSDGHQTGIYSFEYLRQICPCKDCAGQKPSAPQAMA